MSLYFVQHRHDENTCPAKDPQMGAMLLQHLSRSNARTYGIQLQGEAVLDGAHTLVLIVEAEQQEQVERFMQPFQQAGSVEIHPASLCEVVVERKSC